MRSRSLRPRPASPPPQNSNLVLTADRSRGPAEPSGAPETLAGRLHRMGDRVRFDAPDGLAERKAKAKAKREAAAAKGGGGGAEDWDVGGAKRARRVSRRGGGGEREGRAVGGDASGRRAWRRGGGGAAGPTNPLTFFLSPSGRH